MQIKVIVKIIGCLFLAFVSYGQKSLELEEAFAIAMENNYDIKLANMTLEKANNNRSIYNSGYLPSAIVSGNANYSNTNLTLTSQQGIKESLGGVVTKNYGGSVGLNYLLYNGNSRKYQFDRLKKMYEISDAQRKLQIENTFINIYTSFFNIAKNQEQKLTLEEAYKYSKDRLERVSAQNEYGKKSNLDVLNAQVDANIDSLQVLTINVQLENNKRNLNLQLGRSIDYNFEVNPIVVLDNNMTYAVLLENMLNGNMQLKELELNKYVSEVNIKIFQSTYLPSISTSVSYAVNNSDNGPSSLFANQLNNGLNAGLSLSWNVFDGGSSKVNIQNAKIDLASQELAKEKLRLNLENQLSSYWMEYYTQKTIIQNETLNVEVSTQNFSKSKEQYDLGLITSLEYRQAQLNLVNTQLNLLNAKYNAKLAELQLKLITANLTY